MHCTHFFALFGTQSNFTAAKFWIFLTFEWSCSSGSGLFPGCGNAAGLELLGTHRAGPANPESSNFTCSVKTKIPHPTLGVMDGGFTPSNQELQKSKLILSLFLLFCFIFQPSSTSALLKFRIIIQFISLITCVLLSSFPGSSPSVYF